MECLSDAVIASDNPRDVGVDDDGALTEGNRCNCRGRIGAEPGKLAQLNLDRWEAAARRHLPGASNEVAGPGIVAEPRPFAQHLFVRCGGKRFDGRPALDEAAEARLDRGDRGLLQHDFAQPHNIGGRRRTSRRASPGQRPGMAVIMVE